MRTRNTRNKLNEQAGFTLVELLVTAFLMVLVIVAIGGMIQSGVENSSAYYSLVKVDEAGNEAVNVMTRQIRGAVAISPSSTANTLIFAANLDGDIDVEGLDINEMVQFSAAEGFLQKGAGLYSAGSPTMEDWIEGCDQVTFTYWIFDGTTKSLREIAPASGEWNDGGNSVVERIDIQVDMSKGYVGGQSMQRSFTGSVNLRNTLVDLF